MTAIKCFFRDERGATAIEYGLICALLAVVICAAVTTLGTKLYTVMGNITNALH